MTTADSPLAPLESVIAVPSPPSRKSVASRAWLIRLLAPSFSDCFFVAILIWLFVAGASGWKALLMDGDTGWHIRTGQYILDHGHIPARDLFSYSRPEAPWFAWEWLSDVVFALLFGAAGLKGIVLFAGVLIAGVSALLLRYTLWCGANSLIALVTTLLAVGSSTIHFLARPHLFTLLLLPVSLWLIERDRRTPSRMVWLLIPLVGIWANLHGGFAVLLVCLGLLVLGSAVESSLSGQGWGQVKRYTALLVGCCAVTLVNPYGSQLHIHIWEYLRADWIRNLVQEFQAPTFSGEGQLQFEMLLIAGLLTAGFLLARKRITEVLWLLFLAHSSLASVRHAPLYALVAAPLVAVYVSGWWRGEAVIARRTALRRIIFEAGEDLRPAFMRTTFWAVVPVVALGFLNGPVAWPRDFPAEAFPTEMVRRNAELLSRSRTFTTDQWGDYLIYSFYPRQRVYIDGRSDFYGEGIGREYVSLLEGNYRALEIVRQRRFQVILLPVEWPLAELLKRETGWRVIEDNTHAILFATSENDPARH